MDKCVKLIKEIFHFVILIPYMNKDKKVGHFCASMKPVFDKMALKTDLESIEQGTCFALNLYVAILDPGFSTQKAHIQ